VALVVVCLRAMQSIGSLALLEITDLPIVFDGKHRSLVIEGSYILARAAEGGRSVAAEKGCRPGSRPTPWHSQWSRQRWRTRPASAGSLGHGRGASKSGAVSMCLRNRPLVA